MADAKKVGGGAAAAAAKAAADNKPPKAAVEACPGPIIVIIDPGHGDIFNKWLDPGSIYPAGVAKPEAMEKDLALGVSKALKTALLTEPTLVKEAHLTREGDGTEKVTRFQWRIDEAKRVSAKVFISVHLNTAATAKPSGHHMLYRPGFAPEESKKLAEAVTAAYKLVPAEKEPVRTQGLAVLNLASTKVKAGILIESGFISNATDRTTIGTKAAEIAKEWATGVHKYIRENLAILCAE